jgi:membrane protein implicated in regulation of membrane protease activity
MTDQKESNILWLMVLLVGAVSVCLSVSGGWPINLFYAIFGVSLSVIAGWKLWQARRRRIAERHHRAHASRDRVTQR